MTLIGKSIDKFPEASSLQAGDLLLLQRGNDYRRIQQQNAVNGGEKQLVLNISQSGEANATINATLKNDFSDAPSFTYDLTGIQILTLTGEFIENKIDVQITSGVLGGAAVFSWSRLSANQINITTRRADTGDLANSLHNGTSIKITVYP
jgi:hypothetical protein